MTKIKYTCEYCEKNFVDWECDKRRFCSHECYSKSKKKRINIICDNCGKEFETIPAYILKAKAIGGEVRFCSRKCWSEHNRGKNNPAWKGGDRSYICKNCGKNYTKPRSQSSGKLFCSIKCTNQYKYRHRRISKCDYCGNTFINPKNGRFCSFECFSKWHTGVNNFLWKNGVSTENEKARKIPRYDNWRVAVFERDDYICQQCRQRGLELHAHHIKSFADFPKLRYKVDNGITLCVDCHNQIHFNPQ